MNGIKGENLVDLLAKYPSVYEESLRQPETSFEKVLLSSNAAKHGASESSKEVVQEAIEKLVATTLIQPIFSSMRDDPFRSDLFHGGLAEDMFGSQMDMMMSEQITKSANFGFVDVLRRSMMDRFNLNSKDTGNAEKTIDTEI